MPSIPKLIKTKSCSSIDRYMAEVIRGSSITFVLKVLGAAMGLSFSIVISRKFGADGAGIYFLCLTLTSIGVTIGRFGLDNTMLRYVAALSAKNEWSALKGAYTKGMVLSIVISVTVTISMIIIAPWLSDKVFKKPALVSPLIWMALTIFPMAMVFLYSEILKGLKRIRDSQLINGVTVPFFSIIGIYLIGNRFGIKGAIFVYAIAAFFSAILGWLLWRNSIPDLRSIKGEFPFSDIFRSCLPLLIVNVMNIVITWSANLFLGVWGTEADLGVFGAGMRISMLINFILISVNSITAPNLASAYYDNDIPRLRLIFSKSNKIMILSGLPLIFVISFCSKLIMSIFGDDFTRGWPVLCILMVGQLFTLAAGPCGCLLAMTGQEKYLGINSIMIGTVTFLLCLGSIPVFGMIGAAISTALSAVVLGLSLHLAVSKKLGFNMFSSWTI